MHLATHLDVDVVAHETDDEVSVLLELTAPPAPADAQRAPGTLQVVLDRSGSMAGSRLEGAKLSLLRLVDRLDPSDSFGLVAFDHTVRVVVPCAPLADKTAVRHAIAALDNGGSTDLSAGYLRGLQEVERARPAAGATVLLVSDGHANAGVTDPDALGGVARKARSKGVTTTTLGFGLGYDETLLAALAKGGSGNELFAEEPDTAVALISNEVEGLLSQVAQATHLVIRMEPPVAGVLVHNDVPGQPIDGGVMLELGDLYAGEQRKLVLTFQVPGATALGLTRIATLELRWVELPGLVEHTVEVPLHVNVVPGDEAAGRVPDPVVRSELAFQKAQSAKRQASEALRDGDVAGAVSAWQQASDVIADAMACAPLEQRSELEDELQTLDELRTEASYGDASRASKRNRMDSTLKSRQRGRRQPSS